MYTFESRIRYSETGRDRILTPEAMINYFQDCSTFQSEDLGIGFAYLEERHLAWLVNYWQIDILRAPRLGEMIRTGTSPYRIKGFLGERNFMMETTEGERLINVNSVWTLMNMQTGYPERSTQTILDRYELFPRFEMEYLSRKMRLPETHPTAAGPVLVSEQHLDSNGHVNNGQYVRIAHAALEEVSFHAAGRLTRLRVEYKKQALPGQTIYPQCYREQEGQILTAALNTADGQPYAIAEFTFSE
ncbi:MAG: acyl-[acyl-carrier-protein] thioesterase [Lachnospiraceae bacterium]|nr:acyl-[acyl-carrier-protein] thioesterase [Lachnospiraceae bacterium]